MNRGMTSLAAPNAASATIAPDYAYGRDAVGAFVEYIKKLTNSARHSDAGAFGNRQVPSEIACHLRQFK
jgi:hypothetical protein